MERITTHAAGIGRCLLTVGALAVLNSVAALAEGLHDAFGGDAPFERIYAFSDNGVNFMS